MQEWLEYKVLIFDQKLADVQKDGNIKKIEKAEMDVLKAKEALRKAEEKLQKAVEAYKKAGGK